MNRQIGRILQQNQRAAARFAIALEPDGCPAGFRLGVAYNACIRRLGRALGGRLSAALEHHRLERSAALEGLHPTHAGRSRFPHPEGSAERASDLAPARGPRSGPYPRLLSRLRAVEEPRDVAAARAASETRRAPSSKSSHAFSRTTWYCRPQRTARSACDASPSPTPPRPHSSTASASSCPSACASQNTNCRPSQLSA